MQVNRFKEALDAVDATAFGKFVTELYTQHPNASLDEHVGRYSTPAGLVDSIFWDHSNFDYWSGLHAALLVDKELAPAGTCTPDYAVVRTYPDGIKVGCQRLTKTHQRNLLNLLKKELGEC